MSDLNTAGRRFAASLAAVERAREADRRQYEALPKQHVVGAGRAITGAYEQLRNAAENTDDSLLRQRAIRRFFRRLFLAGDQGDLEQSGEDLVTELTLAGYILNNTVAVETAAKIGQLSQDYFSAYERLDRIDASDQNNSWTTDVLAVEIELILSKRDFKDVFLQLDFEVMLNAINWQAVFPGGIPDDYELLLYIALHRSLLRSDDATVRRYLLNRFQREPRDYAGFIASNRQIDELLSRPVIDRISRLISRHSASLRVLNSMLQKHEPLSTRLEKKNQFLLEFESQVDQEYDFVRTKLRRGVTKSIIFLVVTKFLIGLSIELPYDFLIYGEIIWLPLIINFLAPVVYIGSIGLTLEAPGPVNTSALVDQIEAWLYKTESAAATIRTRRQRNRALFSTIYGFLFIGVFGLVSWGLISLGFDLLHLAVFFIFFSAASFLGFRLSRTVRELEVVDSDQSSLTVLLDFVYMPFIVVGQKVNQEYSKLNLIGTILDVVIEMPLKSLLRFVRQWSAFMSSKKDEL